MLDLHKLQKCSDDEYDSATVRGLDHAPLVREALSPKVKRQKAEPQAPDMLARELGIQGRVESMGFEPKQKAVKKATQSMRITKVEDRPEHPRITRLKEDLDEIMEELSERLSASEAREQIEDADLFTSPSHSAFHFRRLNGFMGS